MSMSDDQEKCAICKYHGCCPTDANGFTPCEREYEEWADDEDTESFYQEYLNGFEDKERNHEL